MKQLDKLHKSLAIISCIMLIVGSLIVFDILMSDFRWWYWNESDGLKGIGIIYVSIPLVALSFALRVWSFQDFEKKYFMDFICWAFISIIFAFIFYLRNFEFSNYILIMLSGLSVYFSSTLFGKILRS
ncbi:MAG: hypothetical protein HYV97_16590 [Bdellovibrio sp.]|nr:hypothetical protein [Bdellovibrio sp.]